MGKRRVKRGRVRSSDLPRTKVVVECGFNKILSQLERLIDTLENSK